MDTLEQNRRRFLEQTLFVLSAAAAVILGGKVALSLFTPLLLGFGIAGLLRPLALELSRRTRLSRRTTAVLAALLFYLNLTLLLIAFGAWLFGQGAILLQRAPDFFSQQLLPQLELLSGRTVAFLSGLSNEMGMGAQSFFEVLGTTLTGWLSAFSGYAGSCVRTLVAKLPVLLIGSIFTVALSLFIGMDYGRITAFLLRQMTPWQRAVVREGAVFLRGCLAKLLRAYFHLFLITWAELSAGLLLLQVHGAVSTALLISALDILPVIGSGSVLLPWALLSFLQGKAPFGVGLLLLYAVITVARGLLEPRLIGAQMGLHPVITITAMFAGLRLMGVLGIMLAPVLVLFLQHLTRRGLLHLYR